MSFTYRENQNTPLTWAQLDGNFREVESVQRDVLNQVEVAKVAAESAAESSTVSQLSAELAEEMARISVVRWCGNSTTPPTTRLDGSTLEISDEYGNLIDHLRYNWTGSAWVALNSSAQSLEERIRDAMNPANGSAMVGHSGRTLADILSDCVNALDKGLRPGIAFKSTNRLALQRAIQEAADTGKNVWIPPSKLKYYFDVGDNVFHPSNMWIFGGGGKNEGTSLFRSDGSFTDLLVSGEWDEGVDHTTTDRMLKYRNGFPYTATNIGHDIGLFGIHIDGNGANSGYAPELGPDTGYRGCNILYRYVDGVTLRDVKSVRAPNDCAYVIPNRRIDIEDCEFSENKLPGGKIGATRNGLTVGGTLSGLNFPKADFINLNRIYSEYSEDLGVAVQCKVEAGSTAVMSGAININGISTYRSATYGFGLEVSGDGANQPDRENININNILSIEDSQRTGEAYSAVLLSHKSRAINLSNMVIRDSGGHGFTFSGSKTINFSNVHVDGYNLGGFQNIKGVYGYAVGTEVPEVCGMSNVTVKGGAGRGGDTYGISVTGYEVINGFGLFSGPTTYVSIADSAGINLSAKIISVVASHTDGSATNGWRLTGYEDFTLEGCTSKNSGKGGGAAQKIGFKPEPGTNRVGRFIGCNAYDNQAIPTQAIGYLLGVSATDSITLTSCDAKGNTSAPVTNLGMPNARVHINGFDYTGQTLPLNIGGNGGYLSGRKDGGYHYWRDSLGMSRVKSGTATSSLDGAPYGLKVAVPANATASGAPGQWAASTGFIYIYTGDGTAHAWARSAIAAW